MKKKIIIALLTALSYSNFCNFLFAQCNWTSQNSGVNTPLNAVFFITDEVGYVVGNSGVILKTINGGNTWESQTTNTNVHLYSVFFKDANNGYAVGEQGTILRTTNGGTSWINVSESTKRLKSVSFKSVSEGIIAGQDGTVLKTVDGGNTWSSKNSLTTKDLESVKYADANTVYAVGDKGTVIKSTDAGDTWLVKSSGSNEIYRSTSFADANEGFIAGEGNASVMKKTVNGGNTWLQLNVANNVKLTSVFFLSKNEGYAVGLTGTILKTTDGGSSWIAMTSGTNKNLTSVYFASSTTGYTVGNNGTILKYKCGAVSQSFQENEFLIGMFGSSFMMQNVNGCNVTFTTPTDQGGYKTSTMNVLAEDGFNIQQDYLNEWTSFESVKNEILLAQANGLKMELGAGHYYKPSLDQNGSYLGYGVNIYDNCGNSIDPCLSPATAGPWPHYFRTDIENRLQNIFSQSPYKNAIWGYHICEEASFAHWAHMANDCAGWQIENTDYFIDVETPPINVNNAIDYYKNILSVAGINNHKMVVMEANHHSTINDLTYDGQGIYNPQDYIKLLSKFDQRDVFFEGSYTQFSQYGWQNQDYNNINIGGGSGHYLGPFKSIDYAYNYTPNVHKVVNIEYGNNSNYKYHYHSDPNISNANWLWFQVYNSIIHKARGVWFWWLHDSWDGTENMNIWNSSAADRFDRQYFPNNYKNYISNLARELRYLVNEGLLSTDQNTIIYTKTDHSDLNCIVPPATSYIPNTLPLEKRSENYGLRYSIRTNGTEVIMIICNPLAVAVSTSLDFRNVSNPVIRNSTGVEVIFEPPSNNTFGAVNSNTYKTNRNSNINLIDNTIGQSYNYIPFTGSKKLICNFGPLDVHIYKFKINSSYLVSGFDNGWENVWSNFGSGNIDGWRIADSDKFYPGDFDGDGSEELLCVQTGNGNNWMAMLKYINDDWEWAWSNYGNMHALIPYRNNLIIGDFDGDGRDEILGNDLTGWTTIFEYANNDFQWGWSDYGNAGHAIRPYKDYIVAGDFDGDGKDEIMCADLPNGWTTMFKYYNDDWQWFWSDYGTNHAIRPYRAKLLAGDYNGDGKTDLLGFSTWSTTFSFVNGDWQWGWSTYGADNFNGWTYPLSPGDMVLAGNIDADNKEELMFVQRGSSAAWATSMDSKANLNDGWNWNWSANPEYSVPYIDDWPLSDNGGSATNYFFISPITNSSKFLISLRKFNNVKSCSTFSYLVTMYKTSGSANYKTNFGTESESSTVDSKEKDLLIKKKSQERFIVFPNPASSELIINKSGSETIDVVELKLYNSLGILVGLPNKIERNIKAIKIDVSQLPVGFYYLNIINSDSSVQVEKVFILK